MSILDTAQQSINGFTFHAFLKDAVEDIAQGPSEFLNRKSCLAYPFFSDGNEQSL